MRSVRLRHGVVMALFAVGACLAALVVDPAGVGSLPVSAPGPVASVVAVPASSARLAWVRLDAASGELPLPPGSSDQTTLVDGDFDGDGRGE